MVSHTGLSEAYILRQPGGWLLRQYDLVNRARYMTMIESIRGVETGVSRALQLGFGGKGASVPSFPTYDENMEQLVEAAREARSGQKHRGRFVDKFEQANKLGRYREVPPKGD